MEQQAAHLNDIFQALADPTRRAVLGRLRRGPATIGELAQPFEMALPSFMQHIRVLERSGWIRTRKEGGVRICTIEQEPIAAIEAWLAEQRDIWEARTDRLEAFVTATTTEDTPE